MGRNQALGASGEQLATRFLERAGFIILERNWRCHAGELDLVAQDGQELVVVEVKTRTGLGHGHPFEALSPSKCARLYRLAVLWSVAHRWSGRFRIDAVAVTLAPSGPPAIEHLRNIS